MSPHDEEMMAEMRREGDLPEDFDLPDWVDTVPAHNQPGYYWWRPHLAREPEVMKVRLGVASRCGSPHQYECVVLGGWWFGPLLRP